MKNQDQSLFGKLFQDLSQYMVSTNWEEGHSFSYHLSSPIPRPAKILVVQLSSIGDVIYTTPALNALRSNCPEAHITLLVEKPGDTVVAHNPALDKGIEAATGFQHMLRSGCITNFKRNRFTRTLLNIETSRIPPWHGCLTS